MEYKIPGISQNETISSVEVVSDRKSSDLFYDITMLNGNREITPCTFDTKEELEGTMESQLSTYVLRKEYDYKKIIIPATFAGIGGMGAIGAFTMPLYPFSEILDPSITPFEMSLLTAGGILSTTFFFNGVVSFLDGFCDFSTHKKYKLVDRNLELLKIEDDINRELSEYSLRTSEDEAKQFGSIVFGIDRVPYKKVKQNVKVLKPVDTAKIK